MKRVCETTKFLILHSFQTNLFPQQNYGMPEKPIQNPRRFQFMNYKLTLPDTTLTTSIYMWILV